MLLPTAAFADVDAVVIRPMPDAIKDAIFPDVVEELVSETVARLAPTADCEDTGSTSEATEEAACALVSPSDEPAMCDTGVSEFEAVSIESVSGGVAEGNSATDVADDCAVVDPNGSVDAAEEMLVASVTTELDTESEGVLCASVETVKDGLVGLAMPVSVSTLDCVETGTDEPVGVRVGLAVTDSTSTLDALEGVELDALVRLAVMGSTSTPVRETVDCDGAEASAANEESNPDVVIVEVAKR